jgi:hypothetical protein
MDSVVVLLQSRRRERAQLLQKINHAIPAAGLLVTATQALAEGVGGAGLALAVVEIVTSAMLIFTFARGVRAARGSEPREHGHPHGVDWIDIWAAGVLFAEAAERWHLTHHVSRPTILTAIVTLGLGLFHGRIAASIQQRRAVRMTAEGIYVGARPFRGLHARWADVASISIAGHVAEVRTRRGRVRRLDLTDLRNADEVRAAFVEGSKRLAALRALEPKPATAVT